MFKRRKFYLVDYKSKFDIICDEIDYGMEIPVGEITRKQAKRDVNWRKADAEYYGVPAYIGDDKELNKLYR